MQFELLANFMEFQSIRTHLIATNLRLIPISYFFNKLYIIESPTWIQNHLNFHALFMGNKKYYSIQRYWHNHSQLLSMKMSYTVEGMTNIFLSLS